MTAPGGVVGGNEQLVTQDGEPRDNKTSESASNQDEAVGSLRESFPGHFRPTTEEFDRLWGEGTFVVDTNVLLNLYRYSHSARDELLKVLHALEDKLFLPHQVGREFLDRRLNTIRTQREGFAKLRQRVTAVRGEMEAELRKVLRLRPGEDLPEGLRDALDEVPAGGYENLSERLETLETGLPRASNSTNDDEVWAAVEGLVAGKVGPPYQDEEMREAEDEAERRRSAKIPPGFKDERPGDYVLWRQTIDEAKRSGRPVVLVTDDRKEDWWWIEQGETIGPRRALVEEMREQAGVPFYMYTPDRLMGEARERLDVEVSDESISEAEGLGLETGDDVTSEARPSWSVIDETFGPIHSLTDREKTAVQTFAMQGGIDSVAEELGSSRVTASRLLRRALRKIRDESAEREPYHDSWSEPDWQNASWSAGQRNSPLRGTNTFVDELSTTVQGDEDSISNFIRTLLRNFPSVEIGRKRADSALGDATLQLKFQSAVSIAHAVRVLEETARETGVILSTVANYTYPEP